MSFADAPRSRQTIRLFRKQLSTSSFGPSSTADRTAWAEKWLHSQPSLRLVRKRRNLGIVLGARLSRGQFLQPRQVGPKAPDDAARLEADACLPAEASGKTAFDQARAEALAS